MRRESDASLFPYQFLISAVLDEPAQVLAVLCRCEAEAVETAQIFAADAASVELWQGERCVWSSIAAARAHAPL